MRVETVIVDLGTARGFILKNKFLPSLSAWTINETGGGIYLTVFLTRASVESNRKEPQIILQAILLRLSPVFGAASWGQMLEPAKYNKIKGGLRLTNDLWEWDMRRALREGDLKYLLEILKEYRAMELKTRKAARNMGLPGVFAGEIIEVCMFLEEVFYSTALFILSGGDLSAISSMRKTVSEYLEDAPCFDYYVFPYQEGFKLYRQF